MPRYSVTIYSSTGSIKVKHVKQWKVASMLADGEIVFHPGTRQYRLPVVKIDDLPTNSPSSSCCLTDFDAEANVGIYGPRAQKAAAEKISAWFRV